MSGSMSGKVHRLPLSKMPTSVFLYIPNIIGKYNSVIIRPTAGKAFFHYHSQSWLIINYVAIFWPYLYIYNILKLVCLQINTGYVRVIFAFISFYFMTNSPILAGIFYILSVLMDELDGYAARTFNQCKTVWLYHIRASLYYNMFPPFATVGSSFGAVLDMVTDRWVSEPAWISYSY